MSKMMLGVIAGVFVGAFTVELLRRKRPGAVDGVGERARRTAEDFRRAFAEGYRGERTPVR